MSNKQKTDEVKARDRKATTAKQTTRNATLPTGLRAAQEKAAVKARRRRILWLEIGSIGAVALVGFILVVVKLSTGTSPTASIQATSPPAGIPVAADLINKLSSVSQRLIAAAPTGGLIAAPQAISDPPLLASGKPDLLYVGAEFCPVCATERWAMYIALSKFGRFSPEPGAIHSALRDGDIPTITFYKTTFNSPYFSFTPVETTTNQPEGNYYVPLQKPISAERQLWAVHTGETFPWLDFAGKLELSTAQFSPAVLEGQSFASIVSQVGDNATPVGSDIDASANELVKSICTVLTANRPRQVCTAP